MNDLDCSLTQLENHDWGPPTYDSHLVTECHRLRHVPLKDLGVEDLGTLIGQEIGLPYLIPVAIDLLREDPWAGGHMYPGHLLKRVVEVPASYWTENPELILRFQSVLDEAEKRWQFYQKEVLPAWSRVCGGP
ncbi:MAG: hypothetical protein IT229_01740 [Flavobacteriales bacterium]|nr:hypothetical protein [Flavobacteriales bacterium]